MDDTRFPGNARQDPLLLDVERESRKLVEGRNWLETSKGALTRRLEGFHNLLARLRGTVTLTYCCRSLEDDRDMFPGSEFMAAFRVGTGLHDADQNTVVKLLVPPIAYAPESLERCADAGEWWLVALKAGKPVADAEKLLAQCYPNLCRGFKARDARNSNIFTEYDGYVPEAGTEYDPSRPDGKVLSSNQLETLAKCPLEFFLKYILKVEPLDELKIEPGVWLDPLHKGRLIHEMFCDFMKEICGANLTPDFNRDSARLHAILNTKISYYRELIPPPSEEVFQIECRELRRVADIFLRNEEESAKTLAPRWFEVRLGVPITGQAGELESSQPITIETDYGLRIRVKGIVDRIDEVRGSQSSKFVIWDYKTGSAYKYTKNPPFNFGEVIQNAIYFMMVNKVLQEKLAQNASVEKFGYFFANLKEFGSKVEWDASELHDGKSIIADLCEMIKQGCFSFAMKKEGEPFFSDYLDAFDAVEVEVDRIKKKFENLNNEALNPYRELKKK